MICEFKKKQERVQDHSQVSIRERSRRLTRQSDANTAPNTENTIRAKMIVMLDLEPFLTALHLSQEANQNPVDNWYAISWIRKFVQHFSCTVMFQ